nr:H-type lectin domain-containing protein [Paracoccus saliphilus]
MIRFSSGEIGVARGQVMLVSDFDSGGPMWTGQGDRHVRSHVTFDERFLMPPVVQVAVAMWDLDVSSNQRGDLEVENVTSAGFDIVFHTWGDTRIARMRVSWTAIGAVPDDMDFIL